MEPKKLITHRLKCWPEYFRLVKLGLKKFEIRKNDRNYQAGHRILQQAWDPVKKLYTGEECLMKVTHVFDNLPLEFGIQPGFIIMNTEFASTRVLRQGAPATIAIQRHLEERLNKPGLFSNNEAWLLCKDLLPYGYTTVCAASRSALSQMEEKGDAKRLDRSIWILFPEKWRIGG